MAKRILPVCFTAILLSACTLPNVLTPYKMDVLQGNEITADQTAKLKLGMSRSQVRFVLGTPLLTDPFHVNRWEYVYTDARDGKLKIRKVFTVTFENDKLTHFSGDVLPARQAAQASAPASIASAPSKE